MGNVRDKVKGAEERTNVHPTERQKQRGNYKKGKIIIKGLKISIENPVGSIRSGIDARGNPWNNEMLFTYGYFNGTIGKDGDPIDVYLGPVVDQDFDVYVIDQVDENTRAFDEHKVMFGFENKEQAHKAYLESYSESWTGFNNIITMSLGKFKSWLKNADMIKYPASKLNMNSKIDFRNEVTEDKTTIIKLVGEVIEDETLIDLQKQAGPEDKFDTLILEIASPGGSVSEGLMIMVWLDMLSQAGKDIVTVVTANAYSIASLIMLAADYRAISKHGKVMVHNPMVPELSYANADELEKYATELRNLESIMYELYMLFTGLNKDQIKVLMDNETYLSPQEAVENGFADVVVDIKPKSYQMTTNNKKEINMSRTLNVLNKVIAMVNKADFVNQLYYDTEGGEIEIFQQDPSTYAVGDRTNLKEGEVKLSDGSKLTIEEGVITQIDKTIEETPDAQVEEEVVEEIPAVIPEEIAEIIPEEEMIVPVPGPVEAPVKQKGDMPSSVIETVESVTTKTETVAAELDEDGKPVAKVEVEAKAECDEDGKPVAEFNEGAAPEKILTPEAVGEKDEILATLAKLHDVITMLEEKVKVLEDSSAEAKAKFEDFQKFEDLATDAIDTLATGTASSFKPAAKAVAEVIVGRGSIFQQMKDKRGIK